MAGASPEEAAPGQGIPPPGTLLARKYVVEGVIGLGGMGVVLAAVHRDLKTRVAIKILLPNVARDAWTVNRFLREAQIAAAIQSEHVVRVYDVGRLDSGQPFLVMEYLRGQSLADWLQSRGMLPYQEAVDFVVEACEALAQAHSLGIVHRDIKPSNLFLSSRPEGGVILKILDFGISKAEWLARHAGTADLKTATQEVMGTPAYMSPEQIRSSKSVDPKTDVWALGIVLYELVCGRLPFWADNAASIVAKVVADQPCDPRTFVPGLPDRLAEAMLWCLEKAPERRPETVAQLAQTLAPFGTERSGPGAERVARLANLDGIKTLKRTEAAGASLGRPAPATALPARARPLVVGGALGATAALLVLVGIGVGRTRMVAPGAPLTGSAGVTVPAGSVPADQATPALSATTVVASASPAEVASVAAPAKSVAPAKSQVAPGTRTPSGLTPSGSTGPAYDNRF